MKLKEYLDTYGIRQNFLADKAGISVVAFSCYVLGKKTPNIETAWKIHKATNGEVSFQDWLLEESNIDTESNICHDAYRNNHAHPSKKGIRP